MKDNTQIVGNVTIEGEVYDFHIANENEIIISDRIENKEKMKIEISNITNKDELEVQKSVRTALLDSIKTLLSDDISFVPLKFLFNKQKTTDMIVLGIENEETKIVLAKRKYPPIGWGLFGGMVEKDEDFESNKNKEIEEEAGLKEIDKEFHIGEYDLEEVRGTLTTSLTLIDVGSKLSDLKAGDDITEIKLVSVKEIRKLIKTNQLVPHHKFLIKEALSFYSNNLIEKDKKVKKSKKQSL